MWIFSPWQGQALHIRIMLKEWAICSLNFWNDQGGVKRGLVLLCKGRNPNLRPWMIPNPDQPPSLSETMSLFCPQELYLPRSVSNHSEQCGLLGLTSLSATCYWLIHRRLENGLNPKGYGNSAKGVREPLFSNFFCKNHCRQEADLKNHILTQHRTQSRSSLSEKPVLPLQAT